MLLALIKLSTFFSVIIYLLQTPSKLIHSLMAQLVVVVGVIVEVAAAAAAAGAALGPGASMDQLTSRLGFALCCCHYYCCYCC